jgi:hypothetical protein
MNSFWKFHVSCEKNGSHSGMRISRCDTNPQDEVMAVVPRRHYFYEFSRVIYCPICNSQVEILGMLLTSTRNLAEWENILF